MIHSNVGHKSGNIPLTTYFKDLDFIEWCNFLTSDFLMRLCILFIALKMLKSCSSGLIRVNLQSGSFSIVFCLI